MYLQKENMEHYVRLKYFHYKIFIFQRFFNFFLIFGDAICAVAHKCAIPSCLICLSRKIKGDLQKKMELDQTPWESQLNV